MKKESFFAVGIISVLFSIFGLSASGYDWSHLALPPSISSFWDLQVQTWNKRFKQKKIELSPEARQLGVTLTSPLYHRFAANSIVTVSGNIEKRPVLANALMWIQVDAINPKHKAIPASFHYYTPIQAKQFKQAIRLFAGEGMYRVTIRMPDPKGNGYLPLTSFDVMNVNARVEKDISYSEEGIKSGLQITSPQLSDSVQRGYLKLEGKTKAPKMWVQLKKDRQVWKHQIIPLDGNFSEELPFPHGEGNYEVDILVPEQSRPDRWVTGARLDVKNILLSSSIPIEYTDVYKKRGVELIQPRTGFDQAELTYRIAGRIDPKAPFATGTTHMIVRIEKGFEEATYFLPVHDFRFDQEIGLRFGGGMYQVTVFVPEITKRKSDYFRFYPVAHFRIWSHARQDLRDLMPSRGIESNHPAIKKLARRLTAGKRTDREKAKAIYAFVAKYVRYDVEKFRQQDYAWDDSGLKTLRLRKGVCQDFVFLTISLLRAANLPARFIEGEAGGQQHAWVEVWVDGRWLAMDPTWGSGIINTNGRFIKKYDEQYFDPAPEKFSQTHKRRGVIY
ncbi:transglutaminase-like domain-containing protein [Thermoflavimicrobium dichotomicum]|uniref:Transglutaminase-like superfamily protein n=1 Tax=Thermoflavimicrobium dichotomicum TaxID=46223 RepID=A0A1I3RJ02_9BACL|nr:transglutaminase-like domain-containing protein [Thermoflavimicrobium dichotomicum]SFJ46020.1 Transglutaminase-like superfamily protein [Thermoflavimicrobium dichotomicum]